MLFSTSFVAAFAAVFSVVDAHMIMRTPYPYGPKTLNNSPLQNGMGDYPCKLRPGVYDPPIHNNIYSIGEEIPLSFTGSATHGGGSCQVSLTTDEKPTSKSVWKVIHSIEGGCPANVSGNIEGGPRSEGSTTFHFQIPKSVATGKYTLAWTWLNRIGDRQFWMNCAPITVTESKKRHDSFLPLNTTFSKRNNLPENLPDVFVANINGCMTKSGQDVRYPDPGSSVERAGAPSNLTPAGSPPCTNESGEAPHASENSKEPSPSEDSVSSRPSGGFESSRTSVEASNSLGPSVAPDISSISSHPAFSSGALNPTNSDLPAIPTSSSTTNGSLNGKCSDNGSWNCVDGHSFQRCSSGIWTAMTSLSAGTSCEPGQSSELKMSVKRDFQGKTAHVLRHHGHHFFF